MGLTPAGEGRGSVTRSLLSRWNLRPKDAVRLGALVALVLVIVAVEIASGAIRHWFTGHPLQAGVVTGVLLSVVAYFGFDAVRADLNERRWAPLSHLALLSLAYQTTMLIDVALWLGTGQEPVNDAKPQASDARALEEIRGRRGLHPPTEHDLGAIGHVEYLAGVRALVDDPRWRQFAVRALDRAKWRHRSGVAEWAAPMLSSGESADVLNRVAMLNEWVSAIQERLRHLDVDPSGQDDVVTFWFDWHAEATSLREDLMRAGRGLTAHSPKFRDSLRQEDRDGLAARARDGSDEAARRTLHRPFKVASGRQ